MCSVYLQLFPACDSGHYGFECVKECSEHCAGGICHWTNGSCHCQPGYQGEKCDKRKNFPFSIRLGILEKRWFAVNRPLWLRAFKMYMGIFNSFF